VSDTHTTIFPNQAEAYHWRSTSEAAKYYNKTRRRIVQMCARGEFADAGIPVYRDVRRRWWIRIPDNFSEQIA
jgi:hypothetical protein